MKVYVYPTDHSWFQYLKGRGPLEEVNFWQPGGSAVFRRLDVGDFLIFRLKSPINMLAGGGVFASSSVVPIGVAWEAFEENNGTPDYPTFRRAIAKYKGHSPAESLP
ncbi:MAG TPA: hypothetical protein VMN37_09630, partial [Gemmatimonadales bacterium]|nr:hypothetical protein [Gemmatimonadales bacterium]